jgi:hypothetical protein
MDIHLRCSYALAVPTAYLWQPSTGQPTRFPLRRRNNWRERVVDDQEDDEDDSGSGTFGLNNRLRSRLGNASDQAADVIPPASIERDPDS